MHEIYDIFQYFSIQIFYYLIVKLWVKIFYIEKICEKNNYLILDIIFTYANIIIY